MDRRRQPTGLPPKARAKVEAAVRIREETTAEIEELRGLIASETTRVMRDICSKARPEYVKHLRKFWISYLSSMADQIVAAEEINAIRVGMEANQIRIVGFPTFDDEEREAIGQ